MYILYILFQPIIGAAGSTPVDAGFGQLFKMHVGKALGKLPLDADHAELLETNELTTAKRGVLITQ